MDRSGDVERVVTRPGRGRRTPGSRRGSRSLRSRRTAPAPSGSLVTCSPNSTTTFSVSPRSTTGLSSLLRMQLHAVRLPDIRAGSVPKPTSSRYGPTSFSSWAEATPGRNRSTATARMAAATSFARIRTDRSPSIRLMVAHRSANVRRSDGGGWTADARRGEVTHGRDRKTGSGRSVRGTSRRGAMPARPKVAATRSAVRRSHRIARAARYPIAICAAMPTGRMPVWINPASGDPAVTRSSTSRRTNAITWNRTTRAVSPRSCPVGSGSVSCPMNMVAIAASAATSARSLASPRYACPVWRRMAAREPATGATARYVSQ